MKLSTLRSVRKFKTPSFHNSCLQHSVIDLGINPEAPSFSLVDHAFNTPTFLGTYPDDWFLSHLPPSTHRAKGNLTPGGQEEQSHSLIDHTTICHSLSLQFSIAKTRWKHPRSHLLPGEEKSWKEHPKIQLFWPCLREQLVPERRQDLVPSRCPRVAKDKESRLDRSEGWTDAPRISGFGNRWVTSVRDQSVKTRQGGCYV